MVARMDQAVCRLAPAICYVYSSMQHMLLISILAAPFIGYRQHAVISFLPCHLAI